MINHLKTKTLQKYIEFLTNKYPDLPESTIRSIANDLSVQTVDICTESLTELSKMRSDALLDLEKHRNQFRDHIILIEKNSKALLDSFKRQAYVKPEIDPKTRKPYLKGRTTMVDEMVVFLNKLNETVMDFYKNVYKIENRESGKEFDVSQISLF